MQVVAPEKEYVLAGQTTHASSERPADGLCEPALQLYASLQAVDEVEPAGAPKPLEHAVQAVAPVSENVLAGQTTHVPCVSPEDGLCEPALH